MDKLIARLEECYRLAEVRFGRSFERPRVDLDLRGQKAGVAYLGRNLLRFNAQMYRDHSDDFLLQTVPHEVAHLIADAVLAGVFGPTGGSGRPS